MALLVLPLMGWGQQELRSGKKGNSNPAPITSTSIDADHQALDVNVAGGTLGNVTISNADGAINDGVNNTIKGTVLDLTNSNPVTTAIVDANGTQITSFGGGTQYQQGDASTTTDTMTMAGCVRVDTPAVAAGVIDGDRARCIVDSTNRMWVHVGVIDGTVGVTQSGSLGAGWASGFADGDGTVPAANNQGHDGLYAPVAGSRMFECSYGTAGTDTWFCNYIPINALYTNEMMIRIWIRADTDVQGNQGSMAHLLRLYQGGANASDILTSMIGDSSGNEANTLMIADALWGGVRPANSPQYYQWNSGIGNHQWHKYEMYLNNSTNVYKLWEDDVLIMSVSDPMVTFHFQNFIPMHNWGSPKPTDNNTHFYFDEVEVYSDTGTGGIGSMAAGTMTQGGGGGGGGSAGGDLGM